MSELFASQQCAGSAHARLYFIGHDQNIPLCTTVINGIDKILFQCHYAAFALYIFNQNRTDGIVQLCIQIGNIICNDIIKAFQEREEIVVEHILSGCGKGCHRSAME